MSQRPPRPAEDLSVQQQQQHRQDPSRNQSSSPPLHSHAEARRRELPPLQSARITPFSNILNPSFPPLDEQQGEPGRTRQSSSHGVFLAPLDESRERRGDHADVSLSHSGPNQPMAGTRHQYTYQPDVIWNAPQSYVPTPGDGHEQSQLPQPRPELQPSQSLSGHSSSARTWAENQERRDSSAGDSDRLSVQSGIPSTPSQGMQFMTLDTSEGPMQVPVNVQSASRVADEKRKRNAGASARFRQRRKQKEEESTRAIDELKHQIRCLEEDCEFYRSERDYFATIVDNSPDGQRHFPRQPSPMRIRAVRQPLVAMHTSSPSVTGGYQSHGSQERTERNTRRRLTEDMNSPTSWNQPAYTTDSEYSTITTEGGFPARSETRHSFTPTEPRPDYPFEQGQSPSRQHYATCEQSSRPYLQYESSQPSQPQYAPIQPLHPIYPAPSQEPAPTMSPEHQQSSTSRATKGHGSKTPRRSHR